MSRAQNSKFTKFKIHKIQNSRIRYIPGGVAECIRGRPGRFPEGPGAGAAVHGGGEGPHVRERRRLGFLLSEFKIYFNPRIKILHSKT